MSARLRKALGAIALLIYLCAYIAAAAWAFEALVAPAPLWAQMLYFAAAGLVWVAPLRPLFRWMNNSE
ncbi:MAG: DUF2842 domain-containing protein [Alphaproteobacteria bacterium]|nr:DUF2842 domain-containing protein [Alphaproteobacteria bacterium]